MAKQKQLTIKNQYQRLEIYREPFLRRARDASAISIPSLIPPLGHSASTDYATPFQSVAADGVNTLSAKLLLALFPPNAPFLRYVVDEFEFKKAGKDMKPEDLEQFKSELDKALALSERAVMQELEVRAIRSPVTEAFKHLIVAGNVLLHIPEDDGLRVFSLENYVVRRDPKGNVTCIIVKERVSPVYLPDYIKSNRDNKKNVDDEEPIDLYTKIERTNKKKWTVTQEANDTIIKESSGSYSGDKCPWLPLRFSRIQGESYGRGLIEEYLGDIRSLESLSQSLVEGSASASKVVWLVKPNGLTKVTKLAEAENGDFLTGQAEDVTCVQQGKYNDFKVVLDTIQKIEQRLAKAFMMNLSVQRDAERVTAEEIRFLAQELESKQGGLYSQLSQDLQLPIALIVADFMAKRGSLPDLPKKFIRPAIVTGVEALGRGNDLDKLNQVTSLMVQTLGAEVVAKYVIIPEYLKRVTTAAGVNPEGLIKSQEQIQQEEQQAQMMQLGQNIAPNAVNAISNHLMAQQEQQQAPTQ